MSLKDLLSSPITVPVGGKSLTMNPLTLSDIIKLSNQYYPELTSLMDGKGISATDMKSLFVKSPLFAATLIAYASGNPDEVEIAAKLPFSVQLIALNAVWEASMVDEESVGKLLVNLSNGLTRLNLLLKQNAQKQKESQSQGANLGTLS